MLIPPSRMHTELVRDNTLAPLKRATIQKVNRFSYCP